MSFIDGLKHRLYVLARGERYADETRREIHFHRELDALAQSGNSLGNETYYREEVRRMTLTHWIDRLRQDAGYAIRGLKRSPGFTIGVVLTLALGVGVNGTMFSVLDRVLVQPPAGVVRPGEVHRLYFRLKAGLRGEKVTLQMTTYPQFKAVRAALGDSAALAAYDRADSVDIRDGDTRTHAQLAHVDGKFFDVLGVRVARGRGFTGAEERVEAPTPVAILSDAFWRRAFGGSTSALGKRVFVGTTAYTIIGIAQPGFSGIDLDATDVWVPFNMKGRSRDWYESFDSETRTIARMTGPGDEARLLAAATTAIRPVHVEMWMYDPKIEVLSGPLAEARGPGKRSDDVVIATRIAGVAAIVLLITVANLVNLLLLRASRRRREIAVRRALGVSLTRLVEQFTVESMLLALLAGTVATLAATWATIALRRFLFPEIHWAEGMVEPRTIALIFGASVTIGFICGVAPALRAIRLDVTDSLKGAMSGDTRGNALSHGLLIATQTALCTVLLVGAGLFARSLQNVRDVGVGYDQRDVVMIGPRFDNPGAHTAELASGLPAVVERLRTLPGVEAAAYSAFLPLNGATYHKIFARGDSVVELAETELPSMLPVSPGFFDASGLRVTMGRDFATSDQTAAVPPVIVSDALARKLWPGRSPIGECLAVDERDAACSVVVGVTADAHSYSIFERPATQVYRPVMLRPNGGRPDPASSARFIVLRVEHEQAAAALRAAEQFLRPMTSNLLGLRVRTFDTLLEPQLRPWRLGTTLFAALGLLAILVAAVGVYSVVTHEFNQRIREIGIRLALGARPIEVMDVVFRSGLRFVAIGAMLGLVAALALGRFVETQLFGVSAHDPSTFVAAATALLVVGGIACVGPGIFAARVDPAAALRVD